MISGADTLSPPDQLKQCTTKGFSKNFLPPVNGVKKPNLN